LHGLYGGMGGGIGSAGLSAEELAYASAADAGKLIHPSNFKSNVASIKYTIYDGCNQWARVLY